MKGEAIMRLALNQGWAYELIPSDNAEIQAIDAELQL